LAYFDRDGAVHDPAGDFADLFCRDRAQTDDPVPPVMGEHPVIRDARVHAVPLLPADRRVGAEGWEDIHLAARAQPLMKDPGDHPCIRVQARIVRGDEEDLLQPCFQAAQRFFQCLTHLPLA